MRLLVLTLLYCCGIIIMPQMSYANNGIKSFVLSQAEINKDFKFKGVTIQINGLASTNIDGLILVIRGPKHAFQIWQKEKKYGIWSNSKSLIVPFLYSYFVILSNNQLSKVTTDTTLKDLDIEKWQSDIEFINIQHVQEPQEFINAFIEQMKAKKMYVLDENAIVLSDDGVFGGVVDIPAKVQQGEYWMRLFAFKNKTLVDTAMATFHVKDVGFFSKVKTMSVAYPMLYSICAITIALLLGWGAALIFKKSRK